MAGDQRGLKTVKGGVRYAEGLGLVVRNVDRPNPNNVPANEVFDQEARARFWRKVSPAPSHACWQWHGAVGASGYGNVGRNKVTYLVHRVAYELTFGPIPDGLDVDHLCGSKRCVNPLHLEAVTLLVNMRRRYSMEPDGRETHCLRGHELSPENALSRGAKYRLPACRVCASEGAAGRPPRANEAPGVATPDVSEQRVMRRLRELHGSLLTWNGPPRWEHS